MMPIDRPNNLSTWYIRTAVLWLIATVWLGWWLRHNAVFPAPDGFVFNFWRHAHSHVAFLGWMFNGLVGLALWFFPLQKRHTLHWILFAGLQVAVAGMLVTFPRQGYAAASITFSTLHILLALVLAIDLLVQWKPYHRTEQSHALHWLEWGIVFMVLSCVGPLALGPIMAKGLSGTIWYNLSIYWYLHFQYNAWFIMVLAGLALAWWHMQGGQLRDAPARKALFAAVAGCLLTYALSALWTQPPLWVHLAGMAGSALQLMALWWLFRAIVWPSGKGDLWSIIGWTAITALAVKVLLQALIHIPAFQALSGNHHISIAFLHLVFLGIGTTGLLWLMARSGRMSSPGWLAAACTALFLAGFIVMELALVWPELWPGSGLFLYRAWWLWGSALAVAVGLTGLVVGVRR